MKHFFFLAVLGLALGGVPERAEANNGPFPLLMNSLFGSDGPRATPRTYRQQRRAAPLPRGYNRRAAPLPRQRQAYAPSAAPRSSRSFDPRYERKMVNYSGGEKPGTIVISTSDKFLYLVKPGGKAMRYGVGVGRAGFQWRGSHRITRKAQWPSWTPPAEMRKRQPWLPAFMEGGPANPMGARALYIGSTLYRVHGTNEPWTIGMEMSSGCIRLRNQDVIHLYNQVQVGAKIKVI